MNRYFSQTHQSLFLGTRAVKRVRALPLFRLDANLFLWIITLLALTIVYIVLTNISASAGFRLRDERARIEELLLQNKKAETELANRESIVRLEEEARRIGLVPIGRVKYVELPGNSVALK